LIFDEAFVKTVVALSSCVIKFIILIFAGDDVVGDGVVGDGDGVVGDGVGVAGDGDGVVGDGVGVVGDGDGVVGDGDGVAGDGVVVDGVCVGDGVVGSVGTIVFICVGTGVVGTGVEGVSGDFDLFKNITIPITPIKIPIVQYNVFAIYYIILFKIIFF